MKIRTLTALPVYNEQTHVINVLNEVKLFADSILVVDDGSTDRTPLLLDETVGIDVIRHEKNSGYGAALRSAFSYAVANQFDVLVTIDCDGQHQPRMIPEMAAAVFPAGQRPWDIISGSRYLEQFDANSIPPADRRRINMQVCEQLYDCFGLRLTDAFCGFKAYRVEALKLLDISELGYAMPLQLWIQAVRHKMRIQEFPVPLIYLDENRSFGGSLDDANRRLQYYREVIQREMEIQNVPCGTSAQ